jgi:hypothetical protein
MGGVSAAPGDVPAMNGSLPWDRGAAELVAVTAPGVPAAIRTAITRSERARVETLRRARERP